MRKPAGAVARAAVSSNVPQGAWLKFQWHDHCCDERSPHGGAAKQSPTPCRTVQAATDDPEKRFASVEAMRAQTVLCQVPSLIDQSVGWHLELRLPSAARERDSRPPISWPKALPRWSRFRCDAEVEKRWRSNRRKPLPRRGVQDAQARSIGQQPAPRPRWNNSTNIRAVPLGSMREPSGATSWPIRRSKRHAFWIGSVAPARRTTASMASVTCSN